LIELLLKVSRDQSSTGALLDSKTTRTAHFDFLRSPSTVLTDTNNRVVGVELEKNRMNTKLENVNPAELHKITAVGTNVKERLDCGLLFVSIGYRSMAIDGLPFDAKRNLIPTSGLFWDFFSQSKKIKITDPIDGHSVLQIDGTTNSRLPGVYAVGWCARGATGVIADTQMEARRCAQVVADDYTNGVCVLVLFCDFHLQASCQIYTSMRMHHNLNVCFSRRMFAVLVGPIGCVSTPSNGSVVAWRANHVRS
jgi:hypothetical protein